jgi:hypothetical protein
MLRLASVLVAAALLVAACGGGEPTGTAGTATQPPADQPTPAGQPTPAEPPTGSDDYLTTDDIASAVVALEEQGSWTWELDYVAEGLDIGVQRRVTGTERRQPEVAVDATHVEETGDFRYIRIGDDVWTDVGTGEFFHSLASESPNLIIQYEPVHLAGLIDTSTGWRRTVEYDLVGPEEVNGVAALHYTLNPFDREDLVERAGLAPEDWAGDVWIAQQGGYLVRFVWGPQTVETAAAGPIGFVYDVTEVGCDCPIEAPE